MVPHSRRHPALKLGNVSRPQWKRVHL